MQPVGHEAIECRTKMGPKRGQPKTSGEGALIEKFVDASVEVIGAPVQAVLATLSDVISEKETSLEAPNTTISSNKSLDVISKTPKNSKQIAPKHREGKSTLDLRLCANFLVSSYLRSRVKYLELRRIPLSSLWVEEKVKKKCRLHIRMLLVLRWSS